MAEAEIRGFRTFVDPLKGNCAACHKAPLFLDSGFHNIGLKSFGDENPDLGRYAIKPVAIMKGAFKTPSLRRIAPQGPYFHDGSAGTLSDVVAHYTLGGVVKLHLAPDMKPLDLSAAEQDDLVAFLKAIQHAEPSLRVCIRARSRPRAPRVDSSA
jgi:cytochrome c peroxidase